LAFYRFHQSSGALVAISNDITGANLPKAEGAWKADGLTKVEPGDRPRLGATAEAILAAIEKEGFFLGSLPGR